MARLKLFSYPTLFLLICLLPGCANRYDLDHAGPELQAYAKEHPERTLSIKTEEGVIEARLFDDTPMHRANLVRLVKLGFYDDEAYFHRIVRGFVIQAGAPGRNEPTYLIPPEIVQDMDDTVHCHRTGAIGQAHRDTPHNESNSCDFYIVEGHGVDTATLVELGIQPGSKRFAMYRKFGGAPELDGKYTVFGRVSKGMDVVERIAAHQVREEKPLQKVPATITVE